MVPALIRDSGSPSERGIGSRRQISLEHWGGLNEKKVPA